MSKKQKVNEGASAKKPSRSTLVSSAKKRKDTAAIGRAKEKAERHRIYKLMLAEIPSSTFGPALCYLLARVKAWSRIEDFPELWCQRPRRTKDPYWWKSDNPAPRIAALKKAIKASAPATGIAGGTPQRVSARSKAVKPGASSSKRSPKKKK